MCARPCKRPLLTLLLIEQRLAWGHSVELLYQAQWDSDESRVLKLILLIGGLEFGGKRLRNTTPYLKFITTFTHSMRRRVRAFIQAEGLRLAIN